MTSEEKFSAQEKELATEKAMSQEYLKLLKQHQEIDDRVPLTEERRRVLDWHAKYDEYVAGK